MVFSKAESPGVNVVTDVTDSLFANTNFPGSDLVARNIQRGRDHGLPGYNEFREAQSWRGFARCRQRLILLNAILESIINYSTQLKCEDYVK